MKPGYHAINWLTRFVLSIPFRVDTSQLDRIPRQGPLLAVANHVNSFEAPIMLGWLDNPAIIGIGKHELWKNPLVSFLFYIWDIIPIDRGVVDRDAFNLALATLKQDKILYIAPEGTRNKTGRMLKGKPGVSILAARSGAPILPMAYWGHENFWDNLKHLRRTDFHVVVGEPFTLTAEGASLSRDVREAVAEEIMFKIAELLPEQNRGVYAFDQPVEYRYLVPAE
jgi:1-acyl-sn-glycerol-3-phosphate acyltransferase